MSADLTMPALSPTMEHGTLAKWLVKEGDFVNVGDRIAEIETDKATLELEAPYAGVISQILVPEGTEEVPVGAAIARLSTSSDAPVPSAMGAADPDLSFSIATSETPVSPTHQALDAKPAPAAIDAPYMATPLAKRIAAASGINLAGIVGSGPRGKIIKADLNIPAPRLQAFCGAPAAPATPVPSLPPPGVPFEAVKLSAMRKTIARRLTEAKQTVPHFYLGVDVRLDELLKLRADLNASYADQGIKVSVNDFLIKALAIGLDRIRDANVQFAGDELYRFGRVDVSMAVAVPGGLVTPVIKDAAKKRLSQIATESKEFVTRARAGKLMPEEYQGGTVSISNLGMFGMRTLMPVINPPQALILGIGAAEKRPIEVSGDILVAAMLSVNASFDHRAIDGAVGAEFLRMFKRLVEHPVELFAW